MKRVFFKRVVPFWFLAFFIVSSFVELSANGKSSEGLSSLELLMDQEVGLDDADLVERDWGFFLSSDASTIVSLTETDIVAESRPLQSNSLSQLWSFLTVDNSLQLYNKSASSTASSFLVKATTGGYFLMKEGAYLSATATWVNTESEAEVWKFVKAPVLGGKEWIRMISRRSNAVTIITNKSSTVGWTSTSHDDDNNQLWRFVYDEASACFHLVNKAEPLNKVSLTGAIKSANNMTLTDSEPLSFIANPTLDGHFTLFLKGNDASQFDYNSNYTCGLYSYSFDSKPNGAFRFEVITYEASDENVLSLLVASMRAFYETKMPEGGNPGEYTTAAKTTFLEAIIAAQTIANKKGVTEQELEAGLTALNLAKTVALSQLNTLKTTTDTEAHWYYIVSGPSVAYCEGKAIYNEGEKTATPLRFGEKQEDPHYLWCFEEVEEGQMAIKNMAVETYFAAKANDGLSEIATGYSVTSLGEQAAFTLQADGFNPVHAQQNGSVIVTWSGGLNSASAWHFEEVDATHLTKKRSINTALVESGFSATGLGNEDAVVARIQTQVAGFVGTPTLKGLTFSMYHTTFLKDLTSVQIYYTNTLDRFNGVESNEKQLLKSIPVAEIGTSSKQVSVEFDEPLELSTGVNYFWITATISSEAVVGHKISTKLVSFDYLDESKFVLEGVSGIPENSITIFTKQSMLFNPYDYNSAYYRIPAICTAKDGTLVTATDKRYNSNGDLPNKIDVLIRTSSDNGSTWHEPITIAGLPEQGPDYGYGDPALVTGDDGRIYCMCVAGKKGFFQASHNDPQHLYVMISDDHGQTWSQPREITSSVYDALPKLQGAFVSSGLGLCLQHQADKTKNGRIMFAMACRIEGSSVQCYVLYSDDKGDTWNVSTESAYSGGDESKLEELNDGTVLISVRQSGDHGFNKSVDGGLTWGTQYRSAKIWGTACNGELMVFSRTIDGASRNVLLQSIPHAADRRKVTIYASFDEGETWPKSKVVCMGPSAYSTMTLCADNTIGFYFEDGSMSNHYSMNYVNIPIAWLIGEDIIYTDINKEQLSNISINAYCEGNKLYCVTSKKEAVVVYDFLGRQIYQGIVKGGKQEILDVFQKGLYVVKIGMNSFKIIKL